MAPADKYAIPNAAANLSSTSSAHRLNRKSWISHLSLNKPMNRRNDDSQLSRRRSHLSTASTVEPKRWKIRYFRGMINDIKRRAPYYWSDWKDAWNYRVVPATVYMYFAKYVSIDSYHKNTYPFHFVRSRSDSNYFKN
jgi:HCO3- transporter family